MINPESQARLEAMAKQAVEKWGEEAQINMFIEETLEGALEMHRRLRGRTDFDKMLEEVVDTYIMAVEMIIIFGPENFNNMLDKKLNKFQNALDKS